MQQASIGRIVIIKHPSPFNGSHEHPAIINRVWNGTQARDGRYGYINTTMFPDCGVPFSVTSVELFEDRATAEAYLESCGIKQPVAFFPDRV